MNRAVNVISPISLIIMCNFTGKSCYKKKTIHVSCCERLCTASCTLFASTYEPMTHSNRNVAVSYVWSCSFVAFTHLTSFFKFPNHMTFFNHEQRKNMDYNVAWLYFYENNYFKFTKCCSFSINLFTWYDHWNRHVRFL